MKRKGRPSWLPLIILIDLIAVAGLLCLLQWRYDPIRQAESEYHRLALEIEREHPWCDVISLGKQDTAVWVYIDVGRWYADPANPRYNIFALAEDVVAALERIITDETVHVFIGHMRWDPEQGKYAVRQPWFMGPVRMRLWGALYPVCPVQWWVSGYLAPDSYRWIGNPYTTWWVRLLCRQ